MLLSSLKLRGAFKVSALCYSFSSDHAKISCSLKTTVDSKPGVSSGTHTHTPHRLWLALVPTLPANALSLFQGQLITPINILPQNDGSLTYTGLTSGQIAPEHSSPQHNPIRTKHVFLSSQTCIFLSGLLFFSCIDLCRGFNERPIFTSLGSISSF